MEKVHSHLKLLLEVSTQLQGLLEAPQFFQQVVNTIQSNFQFYSIQIWTVGADLSTTLQGQAGAYGRHLPIGKTLPKEIHGITQQVIKTKKSYLCNDVSKDPNFSSLAIPTETLSQLTVPVIKGDRVIATLNVESRELNAFYHGDLVVLESVAAQLSVAISNRKLIQEIQDINSGLQTKIESQTCELRKAHDQILEQQSRLQKENATLKSMVSPLSAQSFEMVGKSKSLQAVLLLVDKVAPTSASVLIEGESGTGKELIARQIHLKSPRRDRAYVTVNCGALQEALLESELFGHEKGSFTGAVQQKIGLVETAHEGTLFLDEIGEMAPSIQAKLLRFLQEGEFYRVGGKQTIKVNVRVISATNRNLENEVRAARFREDLFFRLNTITLKMPPLRERLEDIPALVEYFLAHSRFGGVTHEITKIDPRLYEAFRNYSWPGNIRELQNTVERMKILSENHEISLDECPENIRSKSFKNSVILSPSNTLEEVEKGHILRTLEYHVGNKTKAAHSLGITIKTLYNKLHRYGVLTEGGNYDTNQENERL